MGYPGLSVHTRKTGVVREVTKVSLSVVFFLPSSALRGSDHVILGSRWSILLDPRMWAQRTCGVWSCGLKDLHMHVVESIAAGCSKVCSLFTGSCNKKKSRGS